MFDRFDDISAADLEKVRDLAREGQKPVVQFNAPIYTAALLEQIDAACAELGSNLEVRFYGHGREGFDARWLRHLPNVTSLSVDCLRNLSHVEELRGLQKLRRLSLGVYELHCPDILSHIPSASLDELWLGDNQKKDFDLSPIPRFQTLKHLQIAGHTRGFDAVGNLQSVSTLRLRCIGKKQSFEILNQMKGLKKLEIILGGRSDINEVSHSGVIELGVIWVRGLSTLGDMNRFPSLEKLQVEDQLHLQDIDLSPVQNSLKTLWVFNCKNLKRVTGIRTLSKLEELRLARTAIDYDGLLQNPLPPSLKSVAMFTGSERKNNAIAQRLVALGYPDPRI